MTSKTQNRRALVVFSGGQDSTTCLFWAREKFDEVECVFFHYGQRHGVEYQAALEIAKRYDFKLSELHIDTFSEIGGNALVDHGEEIVIEGRGGLPSTFVPGRNLIFMTYAAAFAWKKDIPHLVTGVCQTDFSGYPDCREDTMRAVESSIRLGMDYPFELHTPLMYLTKAQTVELAIQTQGLEAQAFSHTCYEGQIPPCGICPSCELRAKGFDEAGVLDPLVARTTD